MKNKEKEEDLHLQVHHQAPVPKKESARGGESTATENSKMKNSELSSFATKWPLNSEERQISTSNISLTGQTKDFGKL